MLALFDLANHLVRRGEDLARQSGITTQQWILLLHIAGDPNFTSFDDEERDPEGVLPSEIARARGVSRANVSALMSGLVDRGLVRQKKDKRDGRRKRVVVTAAGKRALAKIDPTRREANRRLLANLSATERKRFLTSLQECLRVVMRADGT